MLSKRNRKTAKSNAFPAYRTGKRQAGNITKTESSRDYYRSSQRYTFIPNVRTLVPKVKPSVPKVKPSVPKGETFSSQGKYLQFPT